MQSGKFIPFFCIISQFTHVHSCLGDKTNCRCQGVKGVSVKGVKRISALGGARVILEVIFIYNILYININIYNNII